MNPVCFGRNGLAMKAHIGHVFLIHPWDRYLETEKSIGDAAHFCWHLDRDVNRFSRRRCGKDVPTQGAAEGTDRHRPRESRIRPAYRDNIVRLISDSTVGEFHCQARRP